MKLIIKLLAINLLLAMTCSLSMAQDTDLF